MNFQLGGGGGGIVALTNYHCARYYFSFHSAFGFVSGFHNIIKTTARPHF